MKRLIIFLTVLLIIPRSLSAEPVSDNLQDLFVKLSERLIPTVVNILTTQTINYRSQFHGDNEQYRKFFEEFFGVIPPGGPNQGGPMAPRQRKTSSLGSGFVIDAEKGLILTNHHVISQADDIKVVLSEDEKDKDGIEAKLIGSDEEADVALLQIKTKRKLTAAPLGDSSKLKVGEWVMAIGNPFGHGHTVTKGIISAKGRVFPMSQFANYLQTDTPINPGNSGGPLINTSGEVIGVNTFINAAAQGIGFAIPSSYVQKILPELRTKGRVTRGYIGASIEDLTEEFRENLNIKQKTSGVIVSQVVAGEAAQKAGIKPYDVITEVEGTAIDNTRDLIRTISAFAPGKRIKITILRSEGKRGWKEKTIRLNVGTRPKREEMLSAQPAPQKYKVDVGMQLQNIDQNYLRRHGLPSDMGGVLVTKVALGGPAESAGITRGDIIVEVNQKSVASIDEFFGIVKQKKKYLVRFRRNSSFVLATLDLSPE